MTGFEIVDAQTLVDADGKQHDVFEAIAVLPWVKQLCPLMPHEYAHQSKADQLAYAVVEHMLKAANPDTYRAYFRGYPAPNRYWDAPDGQRYWLTKMMINRCWPDSVEPLRLVSEGAAPAATWDGPPWAPDGIGIYEPDGKGQWWPTEAALAGGFQPCRACRRWPSRPHRRESHVKDPLDPGTAGPTITVEIEFHRTGGRADLIVPLQAGRRYDEASD